jgi:hypothetical protein
VVDLRDRYGLTCLVSEEGVVAEAARAGLASWAASSAWCIGTVAERHSKKTTKLPLAASKSVEKLDVLNLAAASSS